MRYQKQIFFWVWYVLLYVKKVELKRDKFAFEGILYEGTRLTNGDISFFCWLSNISFSTSEMVKQTHFPKNWDIEHFTNHTTYWKVLLTPTHSLGSLGNISHATSQFIFWRVIFSEGVLFIFSFLLAHICSPTNLELLHKYAFWAYSHSILY